jgi:hypothetical protein
MCLMLLSTIFNFISLQLVLVVEESVLIITFELLQVTD